MKDGDKITNISQELNLKPSLKQNYVLMDQIKLEENENNILRTNQKVSFSEVLQNFDIPTILNEKAQTKMKKTIKNYVKNKDIQKVEIKFNDKDTKTIERSKNYDTLVKEVTKYQAKVKINREADVLDFTTNTHNLSFSAKSLVNNSSQKDMNDYEKEIKNLLVKNKYDTEEKIIEEENKLLTHVDPEDLKKRYEELKKVKGLLFNQELKNKRQSKIKSKLFHKIKKKQKEREEKLLLQQLEDVDQEAVNSYLEKKKMARIQERIELKHSFNSKFNKTVKRYNLQNDANVKEAIKENLKLRDELMKKIKSNEDDEEEEEQETFSEEEEMDNNYDDHDDARDQEKPEDEFDEEKLLINFDEKTEEQDNSNNNPSNLKGVWGMKFMKNTDDLQSKIRDVLNEIDSEEEFAIDSENESLSKNKIFKKQKIDKTESDEDEPNNNKNTINQKKNLIINSRRSNKIEDDPKNNKKDKKSSSNKITSDLLNSLDEEAKKFIKPENTKIDLSADELKKVLQEEEIKDDEEMFKSFLVENDTNKKEFVESSKPQPKESNFLSGWGSWAGDTKTINAKDFLRKKRHQEYENRKEEQINNNNNSNLNKFAKINNSFDKKFSNYMVKQLPNDIKSREDFEKLNKGTVGRECNSLTMYKKLIQPNIVKKIGQIIEPMKINDNTTAKKLCDIIEKATKKKQRTKAKI
jgi:U3 small nucleolar RNA-associated protein 14